MAFDPRGGIFDAFDREFQEMDRMMERLLEGVRHIDWANVPPGEPVYYGVSVNVGPDGIPHVERFGNVVPDAGLIESGVREPFVSTMVDDEKGRVYVTADMPGVEKGSIKVKVDGSRLHIEAAGDARKYAKTLRLPKPVKEESAKARYNNGVLDVTLEAEAPSPSAGHDVQVD